MWLEQPHRGQVEERSEVRRSLEGMVDFIMGKVSCWRVLSRSVMCSDILTRSMLIRE